MYVLDNNNGVILYPGVQQLATLSGKVDLIAQVGTTVSAYNWNTASLSGTTGVSNSTTDQLAFQWESTNVGAPFQPSVTLSVTDTHNHAQTYTYDFYVPTGSVVAHSGGGNATWPTSLAPSQELISAPSFPTDNASVDATSGSLDTEIDLPSYNPNVPALSLTYDSIAANPEPIIIVENTIGATVPSQVSAQLTFNGGTPLTTYYYSTSGFNTGDVQQIAVQATNATGLATGRYTYSIPVTDIGSTPTTYTGSTTLLNYSGNAFGAGWTLQGLEQITPETGGVILDEGDGGSTLWFTSGGSGGGYTAPAGEFSTLVKNSGGSYTQTLTDGDQITFNSGGYETATIDLSNQHITFAYNGSNEISTITDNYGKITTFSYNSGGYLQTITDPAARTTTLAHTSANLTGVTLPDGCPPSDNPCRRRAINVWSNSRLLPVAAKPRIGGVNVGRIESMVAHTPQTARAAAAWNGSWKRRCPRICRTKRVNRPSNPSTELENDVAPTRRTDAIQTIETDDSNQKPECNSAELR